MNREIYPGANSPLQGDVLTVIGSPNVKVVGLQSIPLVVNSTLGGETVSFNFENQNFQTTLRANIQVNNVTVSDDYDISVNAPGISINSVPTY